MQVQSNLRSGDWEIEKSYSRKYCLSLLCGNCDRVVQSILIRAGSKFKIHSHLEHPIGGPQKPVEHHEKTDESIIFFSYLRHPSVCSILSFLRLNTGRSHWDDKSGLCLIVFQDVCLLDVINACRSSEEDQVGQRRLFLQPTCSLSCTFWVRRRTCPGRRRLLADLSRSSTTCPTSSLQPPVTKWKSSSKKHPF